MPIGGTIFLFISIDEAIRCNLTGGALVVSKQVVPSRTKIIAAINAGTFDALLSEMRLMRPIRKPSKSWLSCREADKVPS
jgi:hypothetical protein